MKSSINSHLLLIVTAVFLTLSVNFKSEISGQEVTPQPKKKNSTQRDGPKVSDTAHTITFGPNGGGALCHESLEGTGRYYLGPTFLFQRQDSDGESVVKRIAGDLNGKTQINANVEFIRSEGRVAAAKELSGIKGEEISYTQIDNLQITRAYVTIRPKELADHYGFLAEPFAKNSAVQGTWPIVFLVDTDKADEFVTSANNGEVIFLFTYTYNGIKLDSEEIQVSFNRNSSTEKIRELAGKGRYLVTAKQIGEASKFIKNEISIKHRKGLSAIETGPIDVVGLFSDLKIQWLNDTGSQEEFAKRVWNEMGLDSSGQQLRDFRPIEISIKVKNIMESGLDINAKQKEYYNQYRMQKDQWKQTAQTSADWFGVFGGGANGSYEQIVESQIMDGAMNETDFHNFVKRYHAVEYDDIKLIWRGIELYDLQKLKGGNESVLTHVTLVPKLVHSYKTLQLRPGLKKDIIPLPTVQERLSMIEDNFEFKQDDAGNNVIVAKNKIIIESDLHIVDSKSKKTRIALSKMGNINVYAPDGDNSISLSGRSKNGGRLTVHGADGRGYGRFFANGTTYSFRMLGNGGNPGFWIDVDQQKRRVTRYIRRMESPEGSVDYP